jgi:bla regulator protein BlaR1
VAEFMIKFFLCNIFISIIIGIFLLAKHLLRNYLTSRAQYNLWFFLLGLLIVPFIPVQEVHFPQIFTWFENLKNGSASTVETVMKQTALQNQPDTANWMNDFSIFVSRKAPSTIGFILCILWCIGIFLMLIKLIQSIYHFHAIKKSALPLQNPTVNRLYQNCLAEMQLKKPIPIYSTAFLRSPIIAGLLKPCIYLPIHLISDYNENDMKFMLLHELGHYKYKDALANYFMNVVGVLYWFHPLVWYALKEMKNDREVACDTTVLKQIGKEAYIDYGNTLINFAEKMSHTSFPFAAGISGSMKEMQKRVKNIANYCPASFQKKLQSTFTFIIIAVFLSGTVPVLSIQALEKDRCHFDETNVSYLDLHNIFKGYKGSFVLYDSTENTWRIYDKDNAVTRISPASTFKIYSALYGLESGTITPEQSLIRWNGQNYVYNLWNADQTLESAMQNSVTWYFQTLDQRASLSDIEKYVQEIGYGNQIVEGDIASYWLNSSLKISPVEQVQLLKKLYNNEFEFAPENIKAVKNAISLYTTDEGTLSGKTGTEEVNGQNTSGWFIGYIEKNDHTYFFSTNIQSNQLASGPAATELTFMILSDLGLWNNP